MKHKFIKMIFFASFVWIAGVILTQDALGADTLVYAIIGGTQTLGTVDLNTGVFTQISTVAVSDYELGVYGGALYGAGVQCGCLIQLNPSTGVPTFAPTYFQSKCNGFGALNGFGSTTDGLFAMAAAVPGGVNYLCSVNPATGVPTLIGSTGVIAGGGTGFLSASNDSSKLYWEIQNGYTDTLYSINTSTGAATLIGTWTFNGYSNTGNPFSMVFTGGTLWANFYSSGFGTINTSNGAQTLVSTGTSVLSSDSLRIPSRRQRRRSSAPCRTSPRRRMDHHVHVRQQRTPLRRWPRPVCSRPMEALSRFPSTCRRLPAPQRLLRSRRPSRRTHLSSCRPRVRRTFRIVEGSAQLAATGAVDGFAIFHFDPTAAGSGGADGNAQRPLLSAGVRQHQQRSDGSRGRECLRDGPRPSPW